MLALQHRALRWGFVRLQEGAEALRPLGAAAARLSRGPESRALQQWASVAAARAGAGAALEGAVGRWAHASAVRCLVRWCEMCGAWQQLQSAGRRWQQWSAGAALRTWSTLMFRSRKRHLSGGDRSMRTRE